MTTIKDIAKISGYSPATISRVLNEDKTISVKDETRESILKIASDLGYTPKHKFFNDETTIGIVQWISSDAEIEDPYYYSLRLSVESFFMKDRIIIKRFYKENYGEIFNDTNLDGLVCLGKFSIEQAENFKNVSKNLIFVDFNPNEKLYHSVVSDLVTATCEVVSYLKSMGHKKIGFIGGRERAGKNNALFIDIREKTFEKCMKKDSNLEYNPIYKKVRDFDAATGYDMMKNLLKDENCPSAFVCASDSIAIGALRAVGDKELSKNRKISVVGFNDIGMAKFTNPPLTTVRINTKLMGEMAGMLMKYLLVNNVNSPINLSCKTELIIRESVFEAQF